MDKFYVGDRVRLVKDYEGWARSNMQKEGVVLGGSNILKFLHVKFDNSENERYGIDYGDPCALELVEKAERHPEEITHNGATYIRKPEPEHVWKFGDWAKIKKGVAFGGEVVFVTGPVKNGSIPFALDGHSTAYHTDEHYPRHLEYISSATIPE